MKYYNIDAPDLISSPAAAMATMGRIIESGATETSAPAVVDTPLPANQPEPAPPAPAPASGETPTPAPAAPATPEPTPPQIPEPTQPAAVTDWREVLKSQQPDTILKELGFDEQALKLAQKFKGIDPKVVGLIDHWQTNGDVKPYLEALSVDYSKLSPEDVMRHHLRKDYPELSKEDFDILYQDRVTDRYKIDPNLYTDEEVRKGNVLLAADVKRVREDLIKAQSDFFVPKAPEKSAAEAPESSEAIEQRRVQGEERYKAEILNDSYTKELFTNKKMIFGTGEDAYQYEFDPVGVQSVLTDQKEWQKAMFKQVGEDDKGNPIVAPNTQTQWLVGAIIKDPEIFNKLATHYKALGAKVANDLLENAKLPDSPSSKGDPTPANPAAAMAKTGRVIPA